MTELEAQLERSVNLVQQQKERQRMSETTAMVKKAPETVVVQRDVSGPLEFTPQQQQMIRDTYANGASEKEFQVLMEVAKVRRLNPLLRQVHFVKRYDNQRGKDIWSVQVSVDGMRAIAERTGKYDGQDEPEYECDKEGFIIACRVRVYRKDWSRPSVGVAYWSEYVQTKKDGSPTKFWADMPHVMIAKCAEAIAIRKAFPDDLGNLYADEEMQQADNRRAGATELSLSPHADSRDEGSGDVDLFVDLSNQLAVIKAELPTCDSYDKALAFRNVIGSGKVQSELLRRIQEGKTSGALTASMQAELGKLWQHCHRQVTKLEEKLKPALESSFVDEPEAPAPMREPGADEEEDLL